MRNKLTKFLTSECPPKGMRQFAKTWKYAACMLLAFILGIGNVWADATYKLFCGATADVDGTNLNTTDFWTSATPTNGTNSDTYTKYVTLGGNVTGTTSLATPANYIAYSVKTTSTEIKVIVYNKNNSTQKLYFHDVKEKITSGKATASLTNKDIASKTKDKEITYTSTNDGKATIYISAGKATDTQIYQIIVTEKGTALTDLYAGYAGYSINLNKGRVAAKVGEVTVIDKLSICPSGDHKPTNNSEIKLVTLGTHYVSFTAQEDCALKLTVNSNVKYTLGSAKNVAGTTEYGGASGTYTTVLEEGETYFINPVSGNTSDFKITKIEFVPVYPVTYAAGEGSGTMDAKNYLEDDEVTLPACTFTAPDSKEFDAWVVTKTASGDAVTVTKDGDDYKFTMPAEAVTVTAQWAAATTKFDVTFDSDGGTAVATQKVPEGETASEPTAPTKDCYTFAGWYNGASPFDFSTNITEDVALTAHWTPNYFTESVDFEEGGASAVSGVASKNIVASNAGSYDGGKESENWAYKGWKIKSDGATVKVLVPAGKMLTYKFGYLAATGHVNIEGDATTYDVTGASKEEGNALKFTTYSWKKDYDAIYTFTTGSGDAAVIKALSVKDTYNATLNDTKSDGSDSKTSVTEVTLPTPTAVSGWTYTGWIANQDVKAGEDTKTAGTVLAAGTYTLLANTTFTAQWAEASSTYDITYVSAHGTAPAADNAASVVLAELDAEGWAHKGWTANADVTVDAATVNAGDLIENGKTVILAGNVTFTAVWKEIFTVTFNSKDGSAVAPVDVEDGASLAEVVKEFKLVHEKLRLRLLLPKITMCS